MKVYDKYSNRYIDSQKFIMLLKIMIVLGVDRIEYNRNGDFYYTHNHSVDVSKLKATAKPFSNTEYTYIIKAPHVYD